MPLFKIKFEFILDMKVVPFFIALVFFISLGSAYEYSDGVLQLNDENFEQAIADFPIMMVKFYAPWYKKT